MLRCIFYLITIAISGAILCKIKGINLVGNAKNFMHIHSHGFVLWKGPATPSQNDSGEGP